MSIKKEELDSLCKAAGIVCSTYSPGDGVTRYKFFIANNPTGTDYFGGSDKMFVALGIKEALVFARGAYEIMNRLKVKLDTRI